MACLFDSLVKTVCSRFFDDGDPVFCLLVFIICLPFGGVVLLDLPINFLASFGRSARCSCGCWPHLRDFGDRWSPFVFMVEPFVFGMDRTWCLISSLSTVASVLYAIGTCFVLQRS